ncbi:hypothetical protein TcasGA2_TC001238 [Tribolium castaneum]|uniref:Secreted protein n=1 Tax=Tribolium castaneum TaxID=7070 RepID=D6WAY4_TRICA|nr:hypothetical protein TcasGA2_TC001238 [Tribolium castaneum]
MLVLWLFVVIAIGRTRANFDHQVEYQCIQHCPLQVSKSPEFHCLPRLGVGGKSQKFEGCCGAAPSKIAYLCEFIADR